jgi:myo-inositol-1(or 4)-monophosphatase
MTAKSSSFVRLAGDPLSGVEGGVLSHALRTTGSSACNIALVASGLLDVYWYVPLLPRDIYSSSQGMRAAGHGMSVRERSYCRNAVDS